MSDQMQNVNDSLDGNTTDTLASVMRMRGYDPVTRTYKPTETPDLSGARHRKASN